MRRMAPGSRPSRSPAPTCPGLRTRALAEAAKVASVAIEAGFAAVPIGGGLTVSVILRDRAGNALTHLGRTITLPAPIRAS